MSERMQSSNHDFARYRHERVIPTFKISCKIKSIDRHGHMQSPFVVYLVLRMNSPIGRKLVTIPDVYESIHTHTPITPAMKIKECLSTSKAMTGYCRYAFA